MTPTTMLHLLTKAEWAELLYPLKTTLGAAPCAFDIDDSRVTDTCITSPACALILSSPEGKRRCDASHRRIAAEVLAAGETRLGECHAGFNKVLAPVRRGDTILGTFGACNFVTCAEHIATTPYERLAQELELAPDLLVAAVKSCPYAPEADVLARMDLVSHLLSEAVGRL